VADYYSILSKAVSALEPRTASARLCLYERARSAMSAEIERATPPFDATDIAAAKHGLKSAIERIEAEALPAWIQQSEGAVCANDCPATADLPAEIEAASLPFDASDIAAQQGLESQTERIEAEAIPAWEQQSERAVCANDCPTTADLPAEIEGACPSFGASEIAAEQGLESAIERIEAEDWLQQLERAVCANDCPATADLPGEIEGAFPPFHASEIVAAEQGLESAIERIEAEAIPEWLRQPERAVRADDCPATAANQNEDSPGALKRLWTRVTGRSAGSHLHRRGPGHLVD
jgi:hypothetical protein